MKKKNDIKNIVFLFNPYWKHNKLMMVVLIVVSSLCPAVATAGSVVYQQTFVTALSKGQNIQYIFLTVVWLSLIIFVPQIIQSVIDICVTTLSFEKVEMKIKKDIYEKVKRTDYKYFDNPDFYDNYTWTVNERVQKANEARDMLVTFFSSVVTIASVIGLIAMQDLMIVLITVISLSLSLLLGFKNNQLLYKKHEEGVKPYRVISYVHRVFYEKVWAVDIKSTNISQKLMEQLDKAYNDVFGIIKKYRGKIAFYKCMMFFLSFVVQVTLTMYLCYQVIIGKIPIGSFVGLIAASGVLKERLALLFNFIQNSNSLSYYAERLRQFEELVSPIENGISDGLPVNSTAHEVEFRNVSFAYPNSSFQIKDISFTIHRGEKIAFVGENGVGKTTLTKLFLRLYDVDNGEIYVDGKNIKEYDVQELRKSIGIAPQTPNLYAMSLRDNMMLYNDCEMDKKLYEACEIFDINEVLIKANASIDKSLTREFEEDGIILSGGEVQKLALARLYINKFGLLILDEPASSLDPLSEYKLNKIMFDQSTETTTIMIAHRLSNIRDADCIYLIDKGEITEQGTHDELMALRGKYYEMFSKQAEKYLNEH